MQILQIGASFILRFSFSMEAIVSVAFLEKGNRIFLRCQKNNNRGHGSCSACASINILTNLIKVNSTHNHKMRKIQLKFHHTKKLKKIVESVLKMNLMNALEMQPKKQETMYLM